MHPIGFWSRKMTPAEMNHSVSDRECLYLIYGIITCRPYLSRQEFDLHINRNCFLWLMEIFSPSVRLIRWYFRLFEYEFVIQFKKRLQNTSADAVSRLLSGGYATEHEYHEVPCYAISFAPSPAQISHQICCTNNAPNRCVGRSRLALSEWRS